jgi:hypothetical protein
MLLQEGTDIICSTPASKSGMYAATVDQRPWANPALANTTGFHIVNELCIANFSGYTDDSRSPKPSM